MRAARNGVTIMTAIATTVLATMALGAGAAQAQLSHANDTGGVIAWSCENEAVAPDIAASWCARFDKYPRFTSVHRHYGDFIAFSCLWSPRIARYALPAVRTRDACYDARVRVRY